MRDLARPAYPDDDGRADPALVAAVEAVADGTGTSAALLTELAAARLLVPVVAVLDEAEPAEAREPRSSGSAALRREKDSHMAVVLTTGRDGRRGLLAFTSVATMAAWDPAARPVAVAGRQAAAAALSEGAEALVVDLAGPRTFAVERPELDALAGGG